jgi:hypothetical protein
MIHNSQLENSEGLNNLQSIFNNESNEFQDEFKLNHQKNYSNSFHNNINTILEEKTNEMETHNGINLYNKSHNKVPSQNGNSFNKGLDLAMDNSFGLDYDEEETRKYFLLDEIDNIKKDLLNANVDLSQVPNIDYNTSIDQMEHVYKILSIKFNRLSISSFSDDLLYAGFNVIEAICDGENGRPDLLGISEAALPKIRRTKYYTSKIVNDTVKKYEISPFNMLCLELIPMVFMHWRKRKNISNRRLINSNLNDSINNIRNSEE